MSMLKNNSYMKRKNRFNANKMIDVKEDYSCIQMRENMKSINLDNFKFTNYVKSQGTQIYKEMNDIYKHLCIYKDKGLDDYFTTYEVETDFMAFRLNAIIKENIGRQLTKFEIVNNVKKCNSNSGSSIRLYFYSDKDNVLKLILVDLFHLAIYSMTEPKYNYEKIYQNNENNKYDIKNIAINN